MLIPKAQVATQLWKSHFCGFLVRLASGVVKWKLTYKGDKWASKLAAKEVPQWGTEPEQLSVTEVYWNSSM